MNEVFKGLSFKPMGFLVYTVVNILLGVFTYVHYYIQCWCPLMAYTQNAY